MRLTLDVFGEKALDMELRRFADRAEDARDAWREARPFIVERVAENFETEGASSGDRWAPLSPRYAEAKRAAGFNGPILVRTGALRHKLTTPGGGGFFIHKDRMRVSWRPPAYAVFHQTGTSRMPARPPIRLTREDRREVVKIVQRHLLGVGL